MQDEPFLGAGKYFVIARQANSPLFEVCNFKLISPLPYPDSVYGLYPKKGNLPEKWSTRLPLRLKIIRIYSIVGYSGLIQQPGRKYIDGLFIRVLNHNQIAHTDSSWKNKVIVHTFIKLQGLAFAKKTQI